MPVYLHCPHCDHPQVVSPARRGRARFCRQCGRAYLTSKSVNLVQPLPISTMTEMHARHSHAARGPSPNVYVLDL